MTDQDQLAQLEERLAAHRRTLGLLLLQEAQFGGKVFAPPHVANGIHDVRQEIQSIKTALRKCGRAVEDLPDDEPIAEDVQALNYTRMIIAQDDASPHPALGPQISCSPSPASYVHHRSKPPINLAYIARPTEAIQYGTTQEHALQPGANPFEYGPAVPPERFHGRAGQRADIKGRIGGIAAQCISIVGMRRSGKSSLLGYVSKRIAEFCPDGQRPLPILIDMQCQRFQTPPGLIEGLRREIERQTGTSPWQPDQNHDPWAVDEGLEALRDRGRRLIVLIDEFQQIGKRLEQFQDWGDDWRAKASAGLMAMVIATTRPLNEIYRICGLTSPFDNIFTNVIIGAFKPEEWHELVRTRFACGGRVVSEDDLAWIQDLASGLPFYTQMAAAQLWQHGDHTRAEEAFVGLAEPRLAELWNDLYSDEQQALRYVCGVPGIAEPDRRTIATLHKHGLLRSERQPFSSAFVKFVRTRR